ncbi:MAG: 50S ribosomal protein L10 [Clostridiales bacterium]|nr:50S ribosomal protein L10 [Clostridiales bacterium]
MTETIRAKEAVVAEIAEKIQRAKSCVIIDYRGLTVAEVTELRNQFRNAGVEYKVLKNTMVARAVAQLGIEGVEEYLNGPTAVAFGYEDAVVPAKIINEFIKKSKKTEIKCGILDGKVLDKAGVVALADLPSREVLLAMVLGTLNAPITGFVSALAGIPKKLLYALNAISEKQGA